MSCILALDQGTTSSRAIVFDQSGAVRAVAQQEFPQIFPQPGWVEHDPLELWATQYAVALEAIERATVPHIAAIGLTNQRETTLVWDRKSGTPVYNAIVWQDRRTASLCEQLKADGLQALIQRKTGLVIDAYFSATKLLWILDNVNGARTRAEAGELAFGTVDSWLLWKLTRGELHVTDVTNASRTMLFNIHTCEWDDELLQLFNVPRALLPEVHSSSEIYGAAEIGEHALPIAGIAGDQQAALFGQACTTAGLAKNTYGTGCFMLIHTGTTAVESRNNLLTTIASRLKRVEYALEGSVFIAGAVVQWLRDGLRAIQSSSEVEELALSVAETGGVYFVPAFAGLGAPHWDAFARGTICGLTRGTTTAHIARAALESIAYQSADVLEAMEKDSGIKISELRVDGGASANNYLMQFQADILGVPVVRPRVRETTALGAAYLAGLAVDVWETPEQIGKQWQVERRFEPRIDEARRQEFLSGWSSALSRARS